MNQLNNFKINFVEGLYENVNKAGFTINSSGGGRSSLDVLKDTIKILGDEIEKDKIFMDELEILLKDKNNLLIPNNTSKELKKNFEILYQYSLRMIEMQKKFFALERTRLLREFKEKGEMMITECVSGMLYGWKDLSLVLSFGSVKMDRKRISNLLVKGKKIPYFYGGNAGRVDQMKSLVDTLNFFGSYVARHKLDEPSATTLLIGLMRETAFKTVQACSTVGEILSFLFPIYCSMEVCNYYFAGLFSLKQFEEEGGALWYGRINDYARLLSNITNEMCYKVFCDGSVNDFVNTNANLIEQLSVNDFCTNKDNLVHISKCVNPNSARKFGGGYEGKGKSDYLKSNSIGSFEKKTFDKKFEKKEYSNGSFKEKEQKENVKQFPIEESKTFNYRGPQCFRCHEYGHKQMDCTNSKKLSCQKCNKNPCVCPKGTVNKITVKKENQKGEVKEIIIESNEEAKEADENFNL